MHISHDPTHRGGDLLAIGFGVSTALWAVVYVGLAPALNTPPLLMAVIALGALTLSGWMLGRWTQRGVGGGVKLGLLLGLINFLIVASLQSADSPTQALRAGAGWVGGFTIVAIALCTLGILIADKTSKGDEHNADDRKTSLNVSWTSWFATIVALTTLPLIISGGVVTGLEAGMAVPDWLTTFGYPMMFYPMAMMQEDPGVYAEHFHRLWGLLVGLAVICLVVQLFRADRRAWVRWLSVTVLLAVIVQGVLGGTRVTEDNLSLAIVHGIFGQIVFATIVVIAACTSSTWLSDREPLCSERAAGDRRWTIVLVVLLVMQLGLGALYRHLRRDAGDPMHGIHTMYTHILLAFIVAGVAVVVGGRAMSRAKGLPVLPRVGKWLVILIGLQFALGLAALIAVLARGTGEQIPATELTMTTLHQMTGALILAFAAMAAVWSRRLFWPVTESASTAAADQQHAQA